MMYARVLVVSFAFIAGWSINGWRIGENIAKAEARRAQDTITIERLNTEKALAVSARHAAEVAAQSEKEKIITKEVIKYVQTPNAGSCSLSSEWVQLHDDAAGVPSNASASVRANDNPERPKTDIDALIAVTDNYATCKENAAKLRALQEWARSLRGAK